jgi:threonylcarbamoyladenosine tRNA methylthiotransferase MtaB
VGEVVEVIPEQPFKEDPDSGLYMGYSDNYLQVVFPADPEWVGKVCRVKIDRVDPEYCYGTFVRVVDEVPRPARVG